MNTSKTILVTGANGQLGQEFTVLAAVYPQYKFIFASKAALPIDDITAVRNFFKKQPVDFCVNCAAYTAVDKAEAESEQAFLINATGPNNLAIVCKEVNALLIHISTDYVFNGNGTQPYKEDAPVNPVSVYGASKLKGEQLIQEVYNRVVIIRTSWVYSFYGNNFVKTMLRLMQQRSSINVVNDQQGSPTYAADLAAAVLTIIERNNSLDFSKPVIYHYSNKGVTTWYNFAVAIKEYTGSTCVVNPITTAQYPTPAKRPGYSVMDCSTIEKQFQLNIPFWKNSLQRCLALLAAENK